MTVNGSALPAGKLFEHTDATWDYLAGDRSSAPIITEKTAMMEGDRPVLEAIIGAQLETIPCGYRVKETAAGTHWIDLTPMMYNWRLVTTPKRCEMTWDRGWCYQGAGMGGFLAAALAALAWDGAEDTEPAGYLKRAA